MPGLPQPTWKQGFARSAGESAYPNLWKGLVGAWEPGLGPTGTTTLHDVSGFKHNGTLNGSMTSADWVVSDGRYALEFDGVDDHVDAGDPSDGRFDLSPHGSIAFWYNPANLNAQNIIEKADGGSNQAGTYSIFIYASIIRVNIGDGTSFNSATFSTSELSTDIWQHIAGVWDGSKVRFYLDGVERASVNQTITPLAVNASLLFGKGLKAGGSANFSGKLDDICVYNRGLSPNEIRQLYTIGRGGIFQRRPVTLAKAPVGMLFRHPGMTGRMQDLVGGMKA